MSARWAAWLLLAVVLATFPYIDLSLDVSLAGHRIDTPLADVAAAALLGVLVIARSAGGRDMSVPALPGAAGYALLAAAGLVALTVVPEPPASAWYLLRKPLFLYLAYGVAVAEVARAAPLPLLRTLLRGTVLLTSAVSIASSVGRIAAGNALWFEGLAGLTNNHKTLAVALAPLIPLLLGLRRSRLDLGLVALALVALALSVSRTAWIACAAGLSILSLWRGRTLATRRGVLLGIVLGGLVLAVYAPLLYGSRAQVDAARSRHSLDTRAAEMFATWPVLGMGGGANVRYEMQTFPHYRVNGVDAHGVVQKVASEYGMVGLTGFCGFVVAVGARLRRAAPVAGRFGQAGDGLRLAPAHRALALWAAFVALHVNLLFSTETFSQTHWAPLAVLLGLSRRRGA